VVHRWPILCLVPRTKAEESTLWTWRLMVIARLGSTTMMTMCWGSLHRGCRLYATDGGWIDSGSWSSLDAWVVM